MYIKEFDSNYVVYGIFALIRYNDDIITFWENDKETAIYFVSDVSMTTHYKRGFMWRIK
ncbi:MAG: hypothetical protein E6356_17980 [Terrisporobacter othiniensis]|nr:hypothetical protein [Terrisporobacter othiniensis]MDU6996743.1 hypothetical protein [Terrisporobacter othiniensis]